VEEDGHLGQVGRRAWTEAGDSWKAYGSREIPTSFGYLIRLNEMEEIEQEAVQLAEDLDQLVPGVREKFRQEKYDQLEDAERTALETPEDRRTAEQERMAVLAEPQLFVEHELVAEEAAAGNLDEARALARQIAARRELVRVISSYRGIVNFEYWRTRCEAERSLVAVEAREFVYQADQAFDEIRLVEAKQLYEQAWEKWAEIFRKYPALLEDVAAEDVIAAVLRYKSCLDQLGEPFPDAFVLRSLLELHRELQPTEYREKLAPLVEEPESSGAERATDPGAGDGTPKADPGGEDRADEQPAATAGAAESGQVEGGNEGEAD
jgi:hypothetical protein